MRTTFEFEAIGTHWCIDIDDPLLPIQRQVLLEKITERIQRFDKTYSRFRDDSLVMEMAQRAGTYRLPEDGLKMMTLYRQMYDLTNGQVTPLIGQLLVDAGYDAEYSLQAKELQKPLSWDEAISYKHPELVVKQPVILDFGAAGKGYLIDLVSEVLLAEGLQNFCVEAGGDMVYRNASRSLLRVGLEHPENPKQVIGVAEILNQSICGSAGNRRKWGQYHHIMNPQTLQSESAVLAAWVIADTGLLADALTTCLFFVPPEKIAEQFAFEYFLLRPDYTFEKSAGFTAELFIKE